MQTAADIYTYIIESSPLRKDVIYRQVSRNFLISGVIYLTSSSHMRSISIFEKFVLRSASLPWMLWCVFQVRQSTM